MMEKIQNEKCCCVCLKKGLKFNRISKKCEKKVSLLTKLKACIPEIKWQSFYFICDTCTNLLNIAYNFRETCVKSDCVRRKLKEDIGTRTDVFTFNIKNSNNVDGDFIPDDVKEGTCKDFSEILDNINDTSDIDQIHEEKNYNIDNLYNKHVFKRGTEDDVNGKDTVYLSKEGLVDNLKSNTLLQNGDKESLINEYDYEHVPSSSESDEEGKSLNVEIETEFDSSGKSNNLKRKQNKVKFSCEKCSLKFSSSTKLLEHCTVEHEMRPRDVKPFVCDRCPMRFSSSSNLCQHLKYHEGIKSNMCSYCGTGFITKTDLINHEKKHLNRREYKCEFCGKSFNTHKHIRSHKLIVHTDSSLWKFVCEVCSKPFPIKSNYDSHMRRHTGDKKFACHLCEKKFTTKCDLQRHTRSHSHVREYHCQHCNKQYKDERVLKVHMAKVHGLGNVKIPVKERKHTCHFCPKAYYAKNKLTRHLYTHSGEKPFNCHICNKKFNDKSYVKQHLRNTHNIDTNETLESELKINYVNISS